jgi:hypothetical protein
MRSAREAAERTACVAERHILEKEARIEGQISLIAELTRDGHTSLVSNAGRLLSQMIVLLVKMKDDLRQAYERVDALSLTNAQVTALTERGHDGQNRTVRC